MRTTKRALVGACAAALLGVGGIVAAAPADASPNTANCTTQPGVTVPFFGHPGGGDWVYSVSPGGGIFFTGNFAAVNGVLYYQGHGNGHTDAWFRQADTTC
jgi:hypothetical protein